MKRLGVLVALALLVAVPAGALDYIPSGSAAAASSTATPAPTATPLAFSTPGKIAVFSTPGANHQPYAGFTPAAADNFVTGLDGFGAPTLATPVPQATFAYTAPTPQPTYAYTAPTPELPASDSGLSLTDVTTNNASTSKHGFLKKLDNTATHYMDGTGGWSTPAGSPSATLAGATTAQVSGGSGYYVPTCGIGTHSSGSPNGLACAAPITATQATISCHVDTAPGAAKTWGCNYIDQTTSTTITGCQISGASTMKCTTTVTGLSITAGDSIVMNLTNVAGSQASTYFQTSITFQ